MKSRLYTPHKHGNYNPIESVKCAFQGIFFALKTEINLTIQIIIGLLFFVINICFDQYILSISNLIFMAMVVSFEMINTIIENICDMIDPNYNPQIKIIKDMAAGAVLVVSLVWLLIICFGLLKILLKILG